MKWEDYLNASAGGKLWFLIRATMLRPLIIAILITPFLLSPGKGFFDVVEISVLFVGLINGIICVVKWQCEEEEIRRGKTWRRKEQLRQKKYEDEYGLVETWSWKDKK